MRKGLLNPVGMVFIGIVFGVVSKYFDLHFELLGNIFSQLPIWILIGVLISSYSENEVQAMLHVLVFCLGMLNAYYVTAYLLNAVYSIQFAKMWMYFAFLSPIFAYFTWKSKEGGIFASIISMIICVCSILCSVLLYRLSLVNILINLYLLYFMFFQKIPRKGELL